LKASPLGVSHVASRALACSAWCLEWHKTTRSSAYADSPIMPMMRLDGGCAREIVLAWSP
jgi:hypothetical protein